VFKIEWARTKKSEWWPVFLVPKEKLWEDWLYFVKRTLTVDQLNEKKFINESIPQADRKLICTWFYDEVPPGENPPKRGGLNDCAHFVSECLKAGGMGVVYDVGVPGLVRKLQNQSNTKTLAEFVRVDAAKRVINTGLLLAGYIIAYAGENRAYFPHGHSVVYMGNAAVANHTA
jgi:hypothetical protein